MRSVRTLLLAAGLMASAAGPASAATTPQVGPTQYPEPDDVELSWASTAPQGASNIYYKIYLALNGDTPAFQAEYETNRFLVSGLKPSSLYTNKIVEYWDVGEVRGSNSVTGSFTTGALDTNKSPSSSPTNEATLLPVSGTNIIHNGLAWSPVTTATNVSYNVYFGKDKTPDASEFRGNTTGTNYLPGNLEEHKRYYWRVDTVLNGTNICEGRLWQFETRGNEDIFIDTWTDVGTNIYNSIQLAPAETPTTTNTNGWVSSTNGTGFRGFDFLHDNGSNKGTMSVTYTPDFPANARYEVFVRWGAGSNNATNTPFTVNYDGGSTTITMNQKSSAGIWRRLGTFNFRAGQTTNGQVIVSNPTNTTGRVVADAVRFISDHTNFIYTNSEKILFMESFSQGSSNMVLTNILFDGTNKAWAAMSSSAQLRFSSAKGQYVKVAGTNWIERSIDTRGMTNITVSYDRETSAGVTFTPEWSTNGGQNWLPLGSAVVGASTWTNISQPCGSGADHQKNFRLRFSTDGSNSTYAYIDNVMVKGTPTPQPISQSPNTTNPIADADVIFLGDSTTSNDGDNGYHWADCVQNRLDLNVFRAPAYTNGTNLVRPTNHGKGGSKAYDQIGSNDDSAGFGPYGLPDPSIDGGGYQRLRYAYEVDHYTNTKFVLIDFGMNDHKIKKVSTGFEQTRTVAHFTNHLNAIVAYVTNKQATPVLIIPHDIWVGEEYDRYSYSWKYPSQYFTNTNWAGSALGRFHEFTDAIRAYAQSNNLDYIDINEAASEYDPEDMTVKGGVHMSTNRLGGHQLYGEVISRYLSERFK